MSTLRILFPWLPAILALSVSAQEAKSGFDRLGILLDVSPEMGFLVPQARKEVRLLNEALEERGRSGVVLREFSGASLERGATLAVPGSKNAFFALQKLYEEEGADGVCWISRLGGKQTPGGLFALRQMLRGEGDFADPDGAKRRQLLLRNAWQDQVQGGARWVRDPPGPGRDPLEGGQFPSEWWDVPEAGEDVIVRSWLVPPAEFRGLIGFPPRISDRALLRELGVEGGVANLDTGWSRKLATRYGLEFHRPTESWPATVTGRRWLNEATLIPFLDKESVERRSAAVFEEMRKRDSIEGDLSRIEAEKIGVLFGFGYVKRDLDRYRSQRDRPLRDWRLRYLADLSGIVAESRAHAREAGERPGRVYASELVELINTSPRSAEPERYARAVARLVREGGADAIYLFTNGYTGGGDYGHFEVDEELLALAIRDAGVRLHVRVPFEFGPVPTSLHRLARASGGGVFRGAKDDPDWEMAEPEGAWPGGGGK